MKYFSYDPNDVGFELHETKEQAIARANECIPYYLDDGWDGAVGGVCWGEIKEIAQKTDVRPDPTGEFDYLCNFELQKPGQEAKPED
ncbi:hypothetical protein RHO15_09765 [Utexia brackfieldae]|uniref:hypothetical protein n=1 Tax=Utexia brackfieldae TaxID=3074108 RepID=UPI00370D1639